MVAGSLGHHDVGGVLDGAGAVDAQLKPPAMRERAYAQWEREVHAALILAVKRGVMSVDEMRRAIEGLEHGMYNELSYYERWAMAMTSIFVERKIFTRTEVELALLGPRDEIRPVAFSPGQRVRIKDESPLRRWRKPHLRIPGYVHGVVGEVVWVVGRFVDPSYAAFRDHLDLAAGRRAVRMPRELPAAAVTSQQQQQQRKHRQPTLEVDEALDAARSAPPAPLDGVYQPLYTVRLLMKDVWKYIPDADAEQGADEVLVDVFHPWLEDAPPEADAPSTRTPRGIDNTSFVAPQLPFGAREAKRAEFHAGNHHQHEHRGALEERAARSEGLPQQLQPLAEVMVELLVRKQVMSRDDIRRQVELLDAAGAKNHGARLVARAWSDPAFKQLLLRDAAAAAAQLGIRASNYDTQAKAGPAADSGGLPEAFPHGHTVLRVCENTDSVHNLVTCTLCSCYPASVLGLSPDWYKGRHYRSRAVKEPRKLLAECFGLRIPKEVKIRVFDSTAEVRYMVLPQRPPGTEGWSEDQLVPLATRDALIGVALARKPDAAAPTSRL